ncbi:MAG: ABC transporter permease [Planctomycetota bacterium]|nr:ABC transporter permease [Planctomycetota bacterium]
MAAVKMQATRGQKIWRSLRRDKGAVVGAVLIGLVVLMAAGADLAPWGPAEMDWDVSMDADAPTVLPPSARHWLGTDRTTYDVFSRLLYGARLSLLTGLAAVALALFLGVPLGALSGYAGGYVDSVIMRAVDVMLAFPSIVLAIAIATILDQRSVTTVIIAVGVVNVPTIARQVRASVLQVKSQEFVVAAQAMGLGPVRILMRHVLPNCLAPIIVLSTLGVGYAILSAAGLNFLGLGPEPTVAEWGVMLTDGYSYVLQDQQWVVVPPGAAIAVTVLGFNLVGDGLRKALDPRAR